MRGANRLRCAPTNHQALHGTRACVDLRLVRELAAPSSSMASTSTPSAAAASSAAPSGWDHAAHNARHMTAQLAFDRALACDVSASGEFLALVQNGALRLVSTAKIASSSGTPLCATGVRCVRFSRDGALLLSGGDDKRVAVWRRNGDSAAEARSWEASKKIAAVEFSADGVTAIWADRFGEVYCAAVDGPAGAAPALALGHLSPVSHLRLAPCGAKLLTADREGHVRTSVWPHAFVIDCYCLRHVTPLQIMLPLVSAPLLLTAADGGREVCVWRGAGGGLLVAQPAAELWKQLRPADNGAEPPAALQAACEWAEARVLLLGFAGRKEVVAADVRCAWDGGGVELLPREKPHLELPEPALSLHFAEARPETGPAPALLVALCASQLLLYEFEADGSILDGKRKAHGAKARGAIALDAPTAAPAAADEDEDDDDG